MTRKRLEAIVRGWQERLGLESWEIRVDWDKQCDPVDANARVWRSATYDRATVHFASDFAGWDDLTANRHAVHELCHILSRDLDEALSAAKELLSPDAAALADKRWDHEIEGFVDRLSVRLVDIGGSL